eukprot:1192852-Prorocentrum_minimum.AAC.7
MRGRMSHRRTPRDRRRALRPRAASRGLFSREKPRGARRLPARRRREGGGIVLKKVAGSVPAERGPPDAGAGTRGAPAGRLTGARVAPVGRGGRCCCSRGRARSRGRGRAVRATPHSAGDVRGGEDRRASRHAPFGETRGGRASTVRAP